MNSDQLLCLMSAILLAPHWAANDSDTLVITAIERAKEIIEKLGKNPDGPVRVADVGIEELALSARPYNVLRDGKIKTIGELVQRSRTDLLRLKNMGARSLDEIEEALKQRGQALHPHPSPHSLW
jgi:DNA-directed RNA polymerase subunit alpha